MRTQIVINNTQIDLLKEVNLNITKQLIDIQNPEQRKTDRTLTIEIPGSPQNDLLFSYIFEVNIDLDTDDTGQQVKHFDPNKKAPVIIFIDSLTQLKGYCQLTDIVVESRDKISYKIVCYGEIGDLFAKIGNAKLEELDFSEFDHTYHRGNIANSWDTEIIQNGSGVPFELGKGYVYPMIDYGYQKQYANRAGSEELWSVEQFRPAIYVKQYIDKIFEAVGYSYTSNFFNSDFFKRLIIPFNSEKFVLNKTEVSNRTFYAGRVTAEIETPVIFSGTIEPVIFNDDTNAPLTDPGGNYNSSTGKFVCTEAGFYEFEASIDAAAKYTGVPNVNDNIVKVSVALYLKSGSTVKFLEQNTINATFSSNPISQDDVSGGFVLKLKSPEAELAVGDEVFLAPVEINILNGSTPIEDWSLITYPSSESYFANAVTNATIRENDTASVSSCTPPEITQREFFGSIIKAFNLYVEPNPDSELDLIVEPRADYYTGQFTDWTNKLDISKEFTISPMAALDAGEYHFTYKEDGDYINKNYKDQHGRAYGDYKLKIDNDFIKNTKKIELVFAPTPLFREDNDRSNRILPYIAFVDSKGVVSTKTSKLRLLYYGGMKDCTKWHFAAKGFTNYPFTQYPYSGHLDDPYDSNIDLGFAPPFQVYYRSTQNLPINYTNQNLFTIYWYAQIKELTDKNSKLVEGWFYLTPSDIQGLSFRKYYFIKDAYYRLLKVENYDPVFSKVTKCQFLKVQEFDAPILTRTIINGGRGTFGPTETTYSVPTIGGTAAPAGSPNNGPRIVTGWDNDIAGTAGSILLTGEGNKILTGSERITVIGGGGNTIYPNLQDVTLINSSGVTISEQGVVYINNQKYFTGTMGDSVSIVTDDSPYILTDIIRTAFCDASEGDITVNLPTTVGRNGKIFEIFKTDNSSNTVHVDGYESETINGTSGQTLSSQYDKLVVVSNGTEWYKKN